jgi:predicted transcriptional regulator
MTTLTIKLERAQEVWLKQQARVLKRSKSGIIRDLIQQQQVRPAGSLSAALADPCGCLSGAKDPSTRPLKGYGRR